MLPSSKVSLKLFIHKSTNRVLFAEAGKDFVDFFVNILRLPVGNLIAILKPDMMLGCLGNIHDSIINLSPAIWSRMHSGLNCHLSSGVKGAPYLVMDDLELKSLSIASIIMLLDEFHLKDGDLEEKVVDMGRDEVYTYLSVLSSLSVFV